MVGEITWSEGFGYYRQEFFAGIGGASIEGIGKEGSGSFQSPMALGLYPGKGTVVSYYCRRNYLWLA